MHNLLQERCELEFERYVAEIHASEFDRRGQACADVPWGRGWGFTQAGVPHLIRDIRAALDAKIWFYEHGPRAMQPLPMGQECVALLRARGPLYLLGLYGNSLQMSDYDYHAHPQIYEFGCGVMAHPSAPDHVRDDPQLREEFPARALPGLCGRLIWSGPTERITAA